MRMTKGFSVFSGVIWLAVFTTIAATPNISKDALIIPKVTILFLGFLWLLPHSLSYLGRIKNSKLLRYLSLIVILMLVQLISSLVINSSPLEQQIFGRTGRGLGFLTWSSIILICLITSTTVNNKNLIMLKNGLALSGLFVITYSIFQSFGLDFFPWDSKTNGVIGTLGNPNFVSSFTSMVAIPIFMVLVGKAKNSRSRILISLVSLVFLITAIHRAESTQGYITAILALTIFLLIYLFYRNKPLFFVSLITFFTAIFIVIAGVLNLGPMSSYLYKVSVQSRGEFWISAINVANSHPFFGVGLDSFGDFYLKYRKSAVIDEYTDSAHNYFLDYAANAGYIFMLLNLLLIILTILSFFKLQKSISHFDPFISCLIASYCVFLAQSLISPISIPLILWGYIMSGTLIGLASNYSNSSSVVDFGMNSKFTIISTLVCFIGIVLIYPYANTDRLQLRAMNNGDGDLAVKVAKMYPESVVRYSILSRALLDSGLPIPALDIARSAVKFNPNSPALWALIVINQSAPIEERRKAYGILVSMDPLNEALINYKL